MGAGGSGDSSFPIASAPRRGKRAQPDAATTNPSATANEAAHIQIRMTSQSSLGLGGRAAQRAQASASRW